MGGNRGVVGLTTVLTARRSAAGQGNLGAGEGDTRTPAEVHPPIPACAAPPWTGRRLPAGRRCILLRPAAGPIAVNEQERKRFDLLLLAARGHQRRDPGADVVVDARATAAGTCVCPCDHEPVAVLRRLPPLQRPW